jgi:hypothetical protein
MKGDLMRITEQAMSWVVYLMTLHGKKHGMNAVCEQEEWEAIELARPGYHRLIQAGIASEAEAEKIARSCQPVLTEANLPNERLHEV